MLPIGHHLQISYTQLRPAQVRYSPEIVAEKKVFVENGIYKGGKLLKVIAVQGNNPFYSLIDHHHHVLKALQEDAETFEVLIEDIWSEEKYHQQLAQSQKEFSLNLPFYCRSIKGSWETPFHTMEELLHHGEKDSLRFFIGNTKIHERYEDGMLVDQSILNTTNIWKKVMGNPPKQCIPTPPFAEFILSDILRAFGFKAGTPDLNQARHYLLKAKESLPTSFKEWTNFHLNWLEIL